jgi:hypothetical protein
MSYELSFIANEIHDIEENGEVVGKEITDGHHTVKVKKGKGGSLIKRWGELQEGLAYKFTMGEFKGWPFVENFEAIKDTFKRDALEEIAKQQPPPQKKSNRDEDRTDIRTAMMQIGDLWEADKFTAKDPEVTNLRMWLEHTSNILNWCAEEPKTAKEAQPQQPAEQQGIINTPPKLMAWAKQNNMMPTQVREYMSWGDKMITGEMVANAVQLLSHDLGWEL